MPALALGEALSKGDRDTKLLFAGAHGRMEMRILPERGFRVVGIRWITGMPARIFSFAFVTFAIKMLAGIVQALFIVVSFRPRAMVGVGGYSSFPVLAAGVLMRVPTLILEINLLPGKANRILGRWVDRICVAHPDMEKFFPPQKLVLTGAPIREQIRKMERTAASTYFRLNATHPTLLVVGGSLGAGKINKAILQGMDRIKEAEIQVIWQTGQADYGEVIKRVGDSETGRIRIFEFLPDMQYAYGACHLAVTRGGAATLAELMLLELPAILIPSPNVSEDHQSKNVCYLSERGAALWMKDSEVEEKLLDCALKLLGSPSRQQEIKGNIRKLEHRDGTQRVVQQLMDLTE